MIRDLGPDPLTGALCRTEGHPTWWDPQQEGETERHAVVRQARAKAVCRRCPVLDACARAFDARIHSGVWAAQVHDPNLRTPYLDHRRPA